MKTVIIENDQRLDDNMIRYVARACDEFTLLNNAANQTIGVFKNAFADNDVILFSPTLIGDTQYQGLMMVLWALIQENELKVSEVHVFGMDEQKEKEFKEVLLKKEDYLREVLEHVKVFNVSGPELYGELIKEEIIF